MNNYPILAAQNTWWAPNDTTITRASITEIEIMDSYIPDSSVAVVDSWDASEAKDDSITCYVIGTKLIIVGNGSGKIAMNADSSYLFSDVNLEDFYTSLLSVYGTNILDAYAVLTLRRCAFYCESLVNFDVSDWVAPNCTDFSVAFFGVKCIAFDLSKWPLNQLTNISFLFSGCEELQTIILPENLRFDKITSLKYLFANCKKLKVSEIQKFLSHVPMSNITEMVGTFSGCFENEVCLYGIDTSNVEDFSDCFSGSTNLVSLDISGWDFSKATSTRRMFAECTSLKEISGFNLSTFNATDVCAMFLQCKSLTSLDLSNWNTSNITDIHLLFNHCTSLTSVGNISKWDVSSVITMASMFENCPKLTGIGDLANWDVSNVTNMSFMFWGASSIKEIDVSKWDVSKVTNFDHFAAHAGLRRIGIEKWNTSSAINMNAMFHNCAEEELDLSGWDVSKVQFFCQMFENSPNLKRVKGLKNWDTSAGLGFDGMFERCYKLEEVDLSSFDTSKAKNGVKGSTNGHTTATFQNMFLSCNNLKKVTVGLNFSINGDGTNTAAANKLILPTPSTDYIEGADGMWYTFNGDSYAPNAIPDRTYNTYYASENLIRDLSVRVNNGTILDIVEAVRERVPNLEPTLLSDLDDIIKNI